MAKRTFKVWVRPSGRWFAGDVPRRAWMWKDDNGIGARVLATLTLDAKPLSPPKKRRK